MFGIQSYIMAGLATTVIGGYSFMDNTISNRDITILQLEKNNIVVEGNYNTCIDSLSTQNTKIENLRVDYNKSMVELHVWKNKPEKVKYEIIYEVIPSDVNLSSERCEDVKAVNRSMQSIRYSDIKRML